MAAGAATAIGTAAAVVGAGAMAYGAYAQHEAAKDAESARGEQSRIRNEEARVARNRRERQLIRAAQSGHANASVYAAGAGTAGSSSYYGQLQSVSGVTSFEMANSTNSYDRFTRLQASMNRLSAAQGDMQFAQGLSAIGKSLFMNASKIGTVGAEMGAGNFKGLLV